MTTIVRVADAGRPTLLLLHGRGGDAEDLVPIADAVALGWGVIAPRGPDAEGGGYAWFTHHAVGVPVRESLDVRLGETAEVAAALQRPAAGHGRMVAVGFSNGGMMAGSLGAARPDLIGGVALLSSAYPLPDHVYAMGGLKGMPVIALSGGMDPFHPLEVHDAGVAAYRAAGAHVADHIDPAGGHSVTPEHARILAKWLEDWESGVSGI